jgi:hypothetical protein
MKRSSFLKELRFLCSVAEIIRNDLHIIQKRKWTETLFVFVVSIKSQS